MTYIVIPSHYRPLRYFLSSVFEGPLPLFFETRCVFVLSGIKLTKVRAFAGYPTRNLLSRTPLRPIKRRNKAYWAFSFASGSSGSNGTSCIVDTTILTYFFKSGSVQSKFCHLGKESLEKSATLLYLVSMSLFISKILGLCALVENFPMQILTFWCFCCLKSSNGF